MIKVNNTDINSIEELKQLFQNPEVKDPASPLSQDLITYEVDCVLAGFARQHGEESLASLLDDIKPEASDSDIMKELARIFTGAEIPVKINPLDYVEVLEAFFGKEGKVELRLKILKDRAMERLSLSLRRAGSVLAGTELNLNNYIKGQQVEETLEVGKHCEAVELWLNDEKIQEVETLKMREARLRRELREKEKGKGTFTVNDVTFEMIPVQGGTFTMGATSEQGSDYDSDEKPTHSVTLSDYMIGKYEVTQELWQAVMGTTVSQQRDKANKSWSLRGEGGNYPMYYVSWDDCQEFIRRLNHLTGQKFRLPTEAEWEYAARGGNKSRGYKYSGSNTLRDVAWFGQWNGNTYDNGNSGEKTHPVGTKSPNELGIYDMSGNVWEWCQDWYGSYSSGSQTNPKGPSSGSYRVLRGGGWNDYAQNCRVAYRYYNSPGRRYSYFGFRVALVP